MQLFEMKQNHAAALARAESFVQAAENGGRGLTPAETQDADAAIAEAQTLSGQIAAIEKKNTILSLRNKDGQIIPASPSDARVAKASKRTLSSDYMSGFHSYIASAGQNISSALYEGSSPAGGYAVPITVDDQIIPLAPNELSIRRISNVIPTTNDLRIPIKAAFGTAALKAESGATANAFGGTAPTIGQFTLSAYMVGATNDLSWELAQDVPAFQSFIVADMVASQQMFEENLYINGTGVGQPQGLIGNVGAGVTEEPDSNGNLVSLNGILDFIGTLNAAYHAGASFLMARPTSITIRKAQQSGNLYNPAFTRTGNQDFLYGYPVEYCASMPAAARGAAPILFGNFLDGYIIGDRGGSGVNVKVLDQPKATLGLLTLLTYRRTDGRVRRSEAIQQYNIATT